MFTAIYFIPLFNITGAVKSYLESHSTIKIISSILPFQFLLIIGSLLTPMLAYKQIAIKEKLMLINWRKAYILETFRLELKIIVPLIITAALSYFIFKAFGYDFSSSPILELLKNSDYKGIIVIFIFSVFIAPVVEEIAFRRVVFTFMARIFGSNVSIIMTSFIFACMHGGAVQIIPLFMLGLVLQYLFIKNNSLYPSILLHCFHNSIVMILFIFGKYVL